MNTTNSTSPDMGALGSIGHYAIKMRPLVPTYLHLIGSAIFPIYAAAHASLRRPVSAAPVKNRKRSGRDDDREKDDGESSSPIETLTTSDAILFPILAGFTLTGLYLIIKWLEDPKLLNQLLGYYFSWIGIFFSFKFVQDVLYFTRSWIFPTQFSWKGNLYKFDEATKSFVAVNVDDTKIGPSEKDLVKNVQSSIPSWLSKTYMAVRRKAVQSITCTTSIRKPLSPLRLTFSMTWLDTIAGAVALFVAFHSALGIKTPWYLTNLQGFAFCYGSLQFMSPGTSSVASLLLSLLFIYDIYMVFYTPMMVTVATKLDVPIKLLFPKNVGGVSAMAMLGLGDIVVPGIVIAFALRFDLYRYYLKIGQDEKKKDTSNSSSETSDKRDSRPAYVSARGYWAERTYTAKNLWSQSLQAKSFPKPYFKATVGGYIAGMLATVLVMTVFDHAQPALLYLVPGVLTTFWGTALIKGEVKLAWNFDESEEQKAKDKEEEEKQKAKEDASKDEKDQKEKKQEKSTEEKEVESGNKPFFTFNLYFPKTPAPLPSEEAKSTPDKEKEQEDNNNTPRLDDAETESESESESETPTEGTSSPDIVSQEEAIESETEGQDGNNVKVESEETDEKKNDESDAILVPGVSTKNDEGGAQAVKRRRRG